MPPRTVRILAGLVLGLLTIPLVLSTPWAEAWVFERLAGWARARHGLAIDAGAFSYRLPSLIVVAENVSVAGTATADHPIARIGRVEVDLGAAILLGRLSVDVLRIRDAHLVFDSTTRLRPGSAMEAGPATGPTPSPDLPIGTVDIEGLDVDAAFGDRDQVRVQARQISAQASGARLAGTLSVPGGGVVSFGRDDLRVTFDRADARLSLDQGARVSGSLTLSTPVGTIDAEGHLPLAADGTLDLQYQSAVMLEALRTWWTDAPALAGRADVSGTITGPLSSPEASFKANGHDLGWSGVAPVRLEAAGRVSGTGLHIESIAMTSGPASARGSGTLAFADTAPTAATVRWQSVGADLLATLLSTRIDAASRATVDGEATLSWKGLRPVPSTLAGQVAATLHGSPGDESARGDLRAEGGDGRWRLDVRQTLNGTATATADLTLALDANQLGHSSISGPVVLQAADAGAALAHLRRYAPAVAEPPSSIGGARLAFDGIVDGTVSAPVLVGTIDAGRLHAAAFDDVQVSGALALDTVGVTVSPLHVEGAGARLAFKGVLPWREQTGRGTIEGHVADASALARALPVVWQPRGTIDVAAEWTGSAREPSATGHVTGSGVAINGLAFESVEARVGLSRDRVVVDELRAVQPDGTLTGSASWTFADRSMTADLTGTNLVVAVLTGSEGDTVPATRALLAGVGLETHVSGEARKPAGTARIDVDAALIDGRPIGPLAALVQSTAGAAHIEAGAPALHARLEGTLTLDTSWPFDGQLTLSDADVADVVRASGLDSALLDALDARADATLEASGTARDLSSTTATLTLTRLDGRLQSRPVEMAGRARVSVQAGHVQVDDPVHVSLGSAALHVTPAPGTAGPGTFAALTGPLSEIVTLIPSAQVADVQADGTVDAELELGSQVGALQPRGRMTLTATRVARDGRELARDTIISVDVDTDRIRVRELRGTILGSAITGVGEAPASWMLDALGAGSSPAVEPATFALDAAVTVGPLIAAIGGGPSEVSGTLNLRVEGGATAPRLDAVRATLIDEGGTVTVGAVALKAQRQTTVRLDDGRLLVDAFEWRGIDSHVHASGSVGLAEGRDGVLRAEGTASLGVLSLVMPGRLDGTTTFDLQLSGPSGHRALEGRFDLTGGGIVVPAWRLSMADWEGSVRLDTDGITVDGLHGQLNGGDARIDGRLAIGDGATRTDTLTVTVRNAFLDVPRGLRSQFNADLQWAHERDRTRLAGTVNVTARPYREPVTELARLASALLDSSGGASPGLPARLASTELEVALTTNGPLALTNSVARVELLPNLRLTGSLGRPALSGQVAVADDGRIQVSGRQYRLRDSRLEFSPERGMMPRLAVTGETRVGDYTVSLRLSGPANEIESSLSSDPPLGERDLQTLVVTGQVDTLGRGGTSDQNAVGAVSGDVLGFAGQFLGFDAVTVGTTDDLALVSSDVDPALRLTVSKRIGRRFEVVLSDNLDDNELTWVIIYRPRPGFELRALSRDNTEYSGEFRQEITFGPGVSPPRTISRRRAAPDRVTAVSVSGEPGFSEQEILSVTSIRPGGDFDFGRWLEDRDRIAALYHARGYLSARIVPTRRTTADAARSPAVTLDYRITRGPRTTLSVSGYDAPPELLAALRRAWAESGLLALLDADLERVMRAHLVERGYLRASISVTIDDPSADRVAAAIVVEPGPVSTERRLGFSGNAAFGEGALIAGAKTAGVAETAWLDSAPLVEWIRTAYADKGYLASQITVDAVTFAGSMATLPIRIVEGPMARIAALTVAGTEHVSASDAAAATGLSVGGPYIPGGERVARLSLERYYRSLGYRDASVSSAADASLVDGRVRVTLTVAEGRQYLVRSVRTSGVESTRASLVDRATHIEPGTPASPSVAETARRQLYDIGTFRSAEVTFEPVDASPGLGPVPVDAVVSLQESKRFLFLYGLEVTNQYQSLFDQRVTSGGVAADVRDRNFLGRGWTLGAGLRYEPSFKSARAIGTVPRLGSRRIRTNLYADTRSEDRARTETVIFRDDETTITLEQRWRPWRPVELSWGYRFNYRNLQFLDATTERELVSFRGTLASLAGALVVDRRDNLFDARRGWLASATTEWGLEPIGSDFGYLRAVTRTSYYQPLGPLTLASSVRWGELVQLTGRPPLTVLDIFFTAGGTQTVRGYRQDSLSADYLVLNGTQVPVGGTRLLVLNGEVRAPLFWILSAAGFVDAGNTFNETNGIALGDLAVGAGFGLRIRTPLAPVRIDLGFPMSRWTGQTSARWHFSIGQMF